MLLLIKKRANRKTVLIKKRIYPLIYKKQLMIMWKARNSKYRIWIVYGENCPALSMQIFGQG